MADITHIFGGKAFNPGSQGNAAVAVEPPSVSLLNAMTDAGIPPADPAAISLDGELNRYRVDGDKPGSLNGWYVAFDDDNPAGAFGSWKAGVQRRWIRQTGRPMTSAESVRLRRRMEQARAKRKAQQKALHEVGRARARRIIRESEPASADHPYLVAKNVEPHTALQFGDRLAIPIVAFDGEVHGLQFIHPDGRKRMLPGTAKKGHFMAVDGHVEKAQRILICEGYATGCTLAESYPDDFVLSAIDKDNLLHVAKGARAARPQIKITICADTDGVEQARAAARAAQALIAVPEFPDGAQGTDFNDLANLMTGVA